MIEHSGKGDATFKSHLVMGAGARIGATPKTKYVIECRKADGTLRWREEVYNILTTVGKNKLLDATFKTGLASPAWYVGLVDGASTPTFVAGDTMASHAGWTENVGFSQATRPAFTPGTISGGAVDNSASQAVFSITATGTIYGAFMADNNTLSGTSGTLYGEAGFASPRSVLSGDTLNVEVSLSIT